jgi:hypothetical protein
VLRANDKRRVRLAAIRHVLERVPYKDRDGATIDPPDPKIVLSAAGFLKASGETG